MGHGICHVHQPTPQPISFLPRSRATQPLCVYQLDPAIQIPLPKKVQHVAQPAKHSALRQVVSHVQPHALGESFQTSGINGILRPARSGVAQCMHRGELMELV